MNPKLHSMRPWDELQVRLGDRQLGHSVVMAALPKDLGAEPRAKAACLWRYDAERQRLYVQSDVEVRGELLGTPLARHAITSAKAGARVQIDVTFNCEKTPPSRIPAELRPILKANGGRCYRSRLVVVPEDERADWCQRRLARAGLSVTTEALQLTPVEYADLGRRGGGIPFVRVRTAGVVTDADTWNTAVRKGIGKGRSFGLGLVLTDLNTAA